MATRFRYEKDMIEPIAASGVKLMGNETHIIFLECPGSPGVADVVFVDFDTVAIEMRKGAGLGPITKGADLKVALAISDNTPTTMSEIIFATAYSSGYIRSRVHELVQQSYVSFVEGGYCRSKFLVPVVKSVVAVEAKRDNWVQGLAQARRYRYFANKTLLALDNAFVSRAEPYIEDMLATDVGLISVDASDNTTQILATPMWGAPLSPVEHVLIGERLWDAYARNHDDTDFFRVFRVTSTFT